MIQKDRYKAKHFAKNNGRAIFEKSNFYQCIQDNNIYYLVALALWSTSSLVNITYINSDLISLRWLTLPVAALLIISEIKKRSITFGSVVLLIGFGLIVLMEMLFDGRSLIILFSLLWCGRDVPFRKTIYTLAVSVGLVLLLSTIFNMVGLIGGPVASRGPGTPLRYSLGFIVWTYPSYCAFAITCAICFISENKFTLIKFIGLLLLNIIIYLATDTRTGFGLSLVVLLVWSINTKWRPKVFGKVLFCKALLSIFTLLALLTVVLGLSYQPNIPIWESLNHVASGRIGYMAEALATVPLTPFGQNIDWMNEVSIIDSSYMRIGFDYGWVGLVVLLILETLAMAKLQQTHSTIGVCIMALLAVQFMFDPLMTVLYFNPWLISGTQQCIHWLNKESPYGAKVDKTL